MRKVLLTIIFCVLIVFAFSQKYTYKHNTGIKKNFNTGQTIESPETDEITIENLGNAKFKLTVSHAVFLFKFSHIEDKVVFVYKTLDGEVRIKSGVDMKLIAKGKPGKFAIDTEKSSYVVIYKLGK